MPPSSYFITSFILFALFALSLPLTMGFSVFAFYWLFEFGALVLAAVGLARIARCLHTPTLVLVAIESPVVFAAMKILLTVYFLHPSPVISIQLCLSIALHAASIGAIYLCGFVHAQQKIAGCRVHVDCGASIDQHGDVCRTLDRKPRFDSGAFKWPRKVPKLSGLRPDAGLLCIDGVHVEAA